MPDGQSVQGPLHVGRNLFGRKKKRPVPLMNKSEPKTLYVQRTLENASEVIAWAKAQGFKTTQLPGDMHVTLAYSKEPLVWPKEPHSNQLTVNAVDGREVEPLGDKGAVVLRFEDPTLSLRWQDLCEQGAAWDFESYKPHVTLTWDAGEMDTSKVETYTGPLVFGPEVFQPIDESWKDSHVEKMNPNHGEGGRFSDGDGGEGGGKESSHGTFPLPDKAGASAVFDVPDDEEGHITVQVSRKADGSYHGTSDKFDFSAPDAKAMRAKLQGWKAKHVGFEKHTQEFGKRGARHSSKDQSMIQTVHDHAVSLGATCAEVGKRELQASIAKVDETLGLVFGWAIICKIGDEDYYDVQEDHIPEQSMLKSATDFTLSERVGKEMHFGKGKGTIAFVFPLTTEIAKAFGLSTNQTGLMIAMKPDTPDILAKFKSGEYTGFSIGGQRFDAE